MSKKRKRPRQRSRRPHPPANAYPSPSERERIIERRDKILRELIQVLVAHEGDLGRVDKLSRQYGAREVFLVMESFQKRASSTELIGNEISVYRIYRHTFARFGGDRPFLSAQEYGDLSFEHGKLNAERTFKSIISRQPGTRERELRDLLLLNAALWDDITPPAVPPRPPGLEPPAPGEYDYPARQLLEWGWDLDQKRAQNNAQNVRKWRPVIGDLVRMALDDGLLNGWPGEAASWAPYHALNVLGYLRAHEVAGQLFPLFERENDWLSDRLAVTWSQMGPQAEPPLWSYLDDAGHDSDARSVVMLGLFNIVQVHPNRRSGTVARLTDYLRHAAAEDDKANAYLVYILDRLEATEAAETIVQAFEQGKVDERIVNLESVKVLDWDDPDLYARLYDSDEE